MNAQHVPPRGWNTPAALLCSEDEHHAVSASNFLPNDVSFGRCSILATVAKFGVR